jgi:hypothetical protein
MGYKKKKRFPLWYFHITNSVPTTDMLCPEQINAVYSYRSKTEIETPAI